MDLKMRRLFYLAFFPAFHYLGSLSYLFVRDLWRAVRSPQAPATRSPVTSTATGTATTTEALASLVPRPLAHARAQVHAMLAQWVAALRGREFLGGKQPNLLDLVRRLRFVSYTQMF